VAKAPKDTADKAQGPSEGTSVDHDVIRELAKLLDETGLTEIEFERGGVRVRVARQGQPVVAAMAVPRAVAASADASADIPAGDHSKHPGAVPSPMVGTAYLGPEPGARPYVEVGSQVRAGQTVLIIEAMKTMNQIPAPRAGRVVQILVEDAQPVEYGEPLMIIE
jgi:acetyl-CoA carboxylase biotin carboxyl carrier protein